MYLWKESGFTYLIGQCGEEGDDKTIFPEPSLRVAELTQIPLLLLVYPVFRLDCLGGPPLDLIQSASVIFLGSLKIGTVLEMWPHKCSRGGKDHFSSPAGYTYPNAAQDAVFCWDFY